MQNFRVYLPLLLVSLCIFFSQPALSATVTYDGPESHCGDECCQKFTITIDHHDDHQVLIHLLSNTPGASSSCFDLTCWTSQDDHTTHHCALGNDSTWQVYNYSNNVTGNYTFDVWICGTNDCWKQFPWFDWSCNDGTHGGAQDLTLCWGKFAPCSEGCDWINAYDNQCYTTIVLHHNTSVISTFSLTISPGLSDCNLGTSVSATGGHGGPDLCPLNYPTPNPLFITPPVYTYSYVFTPPVVGPPPVPGYGTLTVSKTGAIPSCSVVEINVPKCATVTKQLITLLPTSPGCDSWDTITMKAAASTRAYDVLAGQGNFPNPVDISSAFSTVVPFTTNHTGIALIELFDATGKLVQNSTMSIQDGSEHAFRVDVEKLPAGSYSYDIQCPPGDVLLRNRMLVVK